MTQRNRIIVWIAFIVILLAGTGLRFFNLGRLDLWIDEPYHAFSAQSLNETGQPLLPSGLSYGRAPVYTKLVALSIRIFGQNEFAVRFPSSLLGVLCIVMIYLVGNRFFNRRVALLGAFFLAFSYYSLGWARISRFYTLLQFLYLFGAYAFYHGFEYLNQDRAGFLIINRFGIHLGWLALSLLLFTLAYTTQMITVMFFPAILVYVVVMAIYLYWLSFMHDPDRIKYLAVILLAIITFTIGYFLFGLKELIQWGLRYQPHSFSSPKYTDTYFYFNFFNSSYMFPLNAFFLYGLIRALVAHDKKAFYTAIQFLVPAGICMFFFSYKLTNYTYHLYPFFVMIAAYGAEQLYTAGENLIRERLIQYRSWIRKHAVFWSRSIIIIIAFVWLPGTLWFKMGLRAPFYRPGEYNLITTHRNWKWAADFVNNHKGETDIVISSIPLTLLYYQLESDFAINYDRYVQAKDKNFIDENGWFFDAYSGIPLIPDLYTLKEIVGNHASGWFVFDTVRFRAQFTVPRDIVQYIDADMVLEAADEDDTMLIYRWSREQSTDVSS